MRKILAVAFALPLFAACTVGDDPTTDNGDEHPDPMMPTDPPVGDGISGTISADTTWSGTTRIKATTTIGAGVTVTVAAGTTLNFASGANIIIADGATLKVDGTSAAKVIFQAEAGAAYWSGISVNGNLNLTYADLTGGSITTQSATAALTIVDTKMYKASGDYVIMNGGSINMTYSQIGAAAGQTDTTHCNFHINAASSILVNNSNINGSPYGLMFYGGVNANFKSNNWYGATDKDVDTQSGVSGDFSLGYFAKGAPVAGPGATITATQLATAMLANAGVRP